MTTSLSVYAWGRVQASGSAEDDLFEGGNLLSWEHAEPGERSQVPNLSQLEEIHPSDLPGAVELRHSLPDLSLLKGKQGCRVHKNQGRLVIRDGLLLHFFYREHVSLSDGEKLCDEISDLPSLIQVHLNEVKLEISSWGLLVEYEDRSSLVSGLQELIADDSVEIRAATQAGDSAYAFLVSGFDAGDCLVHARVSDSSPNLVDYWYYHWITCESSKSITAGRYEALESTSSLIDTQKFRSETIHGKQFRSVIEAHNRISLDRVDLITLKFRHAIVQDFRDLHIPQGAFSEQVKPAAQYLEVDAHTPTLERYIREEYEVHHKAPTLMLMDVMGNALERAEKDAKSLVELSNMSYNTLIQEGLQRLQWMVFAVSIMSLVVGLLTFFN